MRTGSLIALAALTFTLTACPGPEQRASTTAAATAATPTSEDVTTAPPSVEEEVLDRGALRTPWRLAKVGDWAVYKLPQFKKTFRFEVTGVGPRTVTYSRTDVDSGDLLGEETIDLEQEDANYTDPRSYPLAKDEMGRTIAPHHKVVKVAGKPVRVLVVEPVKSNWSVRSVLAEDAVRPFQGSLVKMLRAGGLETELVDFGPYDPPAGISSTSDSAEGVSASPEEEQESASVEETETPFNPAAAARIPGDAAPCVRCKRPRGAESPCPHCGIYRR